MSKIKFFRTLTTFLAVLIIGLAALPTSAAPVAAPGQPIVEVPGNLLANPSFEAPYLKQCCHTDPYWPATLPIDEVQVPNGWRGFWREADSGPEYPARCDREGAPPNCKAFHRPEFRQADPEPGSGAFANRIRSGLEAMKYFTFYSVHEAGMYQRVTNGIQSGQKLRFSVYLQTWSTHEAENLVSSGQQTMGLKVGIDPYGGVDGFSPNIIWSPPGDSYDAYREFAIEATAQSNAVTVFTYSRPIYPLQHNDVYIDDAALVVVGQGAVTVKSTPRSGSSGVSKPSSQTTSPFPDTTVDKFGNILYVVKPGDTAWGISLRFNTTVSTLQQLNKEKTPNIAVLRIGKTIIVGKVKKR